MVAPTTIPTGPRLAPDLRRTALRRAASSTITWPIVRPSGANLGPVGIVVGATIGQTGTDFTQLDGSILSPGIGAQGGTAADIAAVFGEAARFVLPSSSREVMTAGPQPAALQAAATRTLGEMKAALRLR